MGGRNPHNRPTARKRASRDRLGERTALRSSPCIAGRYTCIDWDRRLLVCEVPGEPARPAPGSRELRRGERSTAGHEHVSPACHSNTEGKGLGRHVSGPKPAPGTGSACGRSTPAPGGSHFNPCRRHQRQSVQAVGAQRTNVLQRRVRSSPAAALPSVHHAEPIARPDRVSFHC